MFDVTIDWWLVAVAFLFAAVCVWGVRGTKNVPIDWSSLAKIMPTMGSVRYLRFIDSEEERDGLRDAQIRVRFATDATGKLESVKYYSTRRNDGKHAETLDVMRSGEFGFIVTFLDEVPVTFTRVGGRIIYDPDFEPQETNALVLFLRRFRDYAEECVLIDSRYS